MRLINADKYKKDIEHYRNTICYQRNVTMDDCVRILDKQEDVLDKIRAEIEARLCDVVSDYTDGYRTAIQGNLAIIDRYKAESEDKCKNCEYYHNPDYTRCHECKAGKERMNETDN